MQELKPALNSAVNGMHDLLSEPAAEKEVKLTPLPKIAKPKAVVKKVVPAPEPPCADIKDLANRALSKLHGSDPLAKVISDISQPKPEATPVATAAPTADAGAGDMAELAGNALKNLNNMSAPEKAEIATMAKKALANMEGGSQETVSA